MTYPQSHLKLLEAEASELYTGRSCARMLVGDITEYLRNMGNSEGWIDGLHLRMYIAQQEGMYDRLEAEQKEQTELIKKQLFD
jgi:hypothetical protein